MPTIIAERKSSKPSSRFKQSVQMMPGTAAWIPMYRNLKRGINLQFNFKNIGKAACGFSMNNKEIIIMASNKALVPEAKQALDQFKMQAASEVGVSLNNGYNGDLTARQAGSIGGQMVNNMNPVRTMKFDRHNRISQGHKVTVSYSVSLTV